MLGLLARGCSGSSRVTDSSPPQVRKAVACICWTCSLGLRKSGNDAQSGPTQPADEYGSSCNSHPPPRAVTHSVSELLLLPFPIPRCSIVQEGLAARQATAAPAFDWSLRGAEKAEHVKEAQGGLTASPARCCPGRSGQRSPKSRDCSRPQGPGRALTPHVNHRRTPPIHRA